MRSRGQPTRGGPSARGIRGWGGLTTSQPLEHVTKCFTRLRLLLTQDSSRKIEENRSFEGVSIHGRIILKWSSND
jgi:hypothetical protein